MSLGSALDQRDRRSPLSKNTERTQRAHNPERIREITHRTQWSTAVFSENTSVFTLLASLILKEYEETTIDHGRIQQNTSEYAVLARESFLTGTTKENPMRAPPPSHSSALRHVEIGVSMGTD